MGMCFIKSSSLCLHFGAAKTSLVPLAQTSLRSNFTCAPHELHCESIESLSCHPERRAKPAVEPEGRCIASGSKEHYQRLALAKGELYRFPRSCSVTPRTAPRFDSACAPLRMTRVGAIRLVNLMNNEVASLMNDGYVLSEPESTKGRGMGVCFIESSSLCLRFGKGGIGEEILF